MPDEKIILPSILREGSTLGLILVLLDLHDRFGFWLPNLAKDPAQKQGHQENWNGNGDEHRQDQQGVARDAIQSLIFFWQGFINFLITFFLLILPILITIAIPFFLAFLLLRWIFRKVWKPKAKAVAQVQETKN